MGEVKVESHSTGPTFSRLTSLSFYVNRPSHSWVTIFSKFDLENHRSKSWVRSQFKVTMWILASYRLAYLSFHVNRAPHSWVTTFSKLTLKNQGSRLWVRSQWVQSHNVGLTSYRLTSLWFHVNRPSHSWDTAFSKFDLENLGSRSNDHDVANYGSKQFQRTLNGINPSSGVRDKRSTKPGPSAAWFDKFLACGQARIYLSLSQSEPKGGK